MKKVIKIILFTSITIIMVLPFTSCSLLKDNFTSDDAAQKARTQELIECFNNKDVHRLKSMFCKTTAVSPDIDKQIQNGINFIHGKIISHGSILSGSSESWEHGRRTLLNISPHIPHIKTDAKKEYDIRFYDDVVCTAHRDYEGISDIVITASDGQKCEIGKHIK